LAGEPRQRVTDPIARPIPCVSSLFFSLSSCLPLAHEDAAGTGWGGGQSVDNSATSSRNDDTQDKRPKQRAAGGAGVEAMTVARLEPSSGGVGLWLARAPPTFGSKPNRRRQCRQHRLNHHLAAGHLPPSHSPQPCVSTIQYSNCDEDFSRNKSTPTAHETAVRTHCAMQINRTRPHSLRNPALTVRQALCTNNFTAEPSHPRLHKAAGFRCGGHPSRQAKKSNLQGGQTLPPLLHSFFNIQSL